MNTACAASSASWWSPVMRRQTDSTIAPWRSMRAASACSEPEANPASSSRSVVVRAGDSVGIGSLLSQDMSPPEAAELQPAAASGAVAVGEADLVEVEGVVDAVLGAAGEHQVLDLGEVEVAVAV